MILSPSTEDPSEGVFNTLPEVVFVYNFSGKENSSIFQISFSRYRVVFSQQTPTTCPAGNRRKKTMSTERRVPPPQYRKEAPGKRSFGRNGEEAHTMPAYTVHRLANTPDPRDIRGRDGPTGTSLKGCERFIW